MDRYNQSEHRIWAQELKEWFMSWMHEPACELCGSRCPPIDIAHSRKRFDIKNREQYFHAAMLCRKHHDFIELGRTHEEMFNAVSNIIDRRNI